MAGSIKGITVEIGGETTGLDKALQSSNKESASLSKELKAVESALKLDPTNVEMLTQKEELLGKSVSAAADKLNTLRNAQKQVEDQFKSGEIGEEAYRAFQREVATAEGKLKQAEKAVNDFGTASNNAGKDIEGLTEEVKTSSETADNAGERFDMLGSILAGVSAAVAGMAAAVSSAAVGAATALANMSVDAALYADNIATLSVQTGVSTDTLQAYSYVQELVDVSTETLTGSMAKQLKSMTNAQKGSKDVVAAYKAIGVSATDVNGNLRDSETVYWEVIDALGKVEDETQRDSLAMTLLGKSAKDLNPLIEMGSESLNGLMEEAMSAGAVMSEDTLSSLLEVSDGMERVKSSTEAAKNTIGTVTAGALTAYYEGANDIVKNFTGILNSVIMGEEQGEWALDEFAESITSMAENVSAGIPEIIDTFVQLFDNLMIVAKKAMPTVVSTISSVLPEILSTISAMLPDMIGIVSEILMAVISTILDALPDIIGCGNDIVLSLVSGIAEALPKLLLSAGNAIMTIVIGITEALPKILDAALQIILALAEGLVTAIPMLIEALPSVILSIVDFIIGSIPKIIDAGIKLLVSLVGALPTIITAIVKVIPEIIDGIISAVMEELPLIVEAGIQLFIALVKAMPEIITTVCKAIPQIVSGLTGNLTKTLPTMIAAGVRLFTAIVSNMPEILKGIVKAIPQIISGIVKAIGDSRSKLADAGLNLIKGLWQGISDAGTWLWNKMSGFFDGVVNKVKDFFGIASPSKLFRDQVGKYLAEGLGEGFTDEMLSVSSDMQDAIPTEFDMAVNAASNQMIADDGERTFEIVTPVSLGGQKLTKVVSRIQYNTKKNRARVVGVTAE